MPPHLMPVASWVLTFPETAIGDEKQRGPDPMPRRAELTLSKRTVDGLAVEGKDAVFWDRELTGFGVRVYPSGRKIFVVQSRGPGGSKRIALGRHGELTVEQARKQAVVVIDRIKRGENPVAGPPEPAFTVDDLAQRYLETHVAVNCNAHTAGIYRGSLDNHILPALGTMPIGSVGRPEASALHYGLRDTPRAANRALMVLSKMFSLAEDWGLAPVGGNPCRFVRRYKEGMRERFLTPDEYRRLGRALCALEARGPVTGARRGGAAVADADRVPAHGDSDPAMGRCGPKGWRVPVARRQDGRTDGTADAHGGGGCSRESSASHAAPGCSLGRHRTGICRSSPHTGATRGDSADLRTCESMTSAIPSRAGRSRSARA